MLRLALLFLLSTSSAWADWVAIGKSPDFTMHVDPQSMRRSGNIASAWIMGDYAKTKKKRFPPPVSWVDFNSIKELKNFDCSKGMHRTDKTVIMAGCWAKAIRCIPSLRYRTTFRCPMASWILPSSITFAPTRDKALAKPLRCQAIAN